MNVKRQIQCVAPCDNDKPDESKKKKKVEKIHILKYISFDLSGYISIVNEFFHT